MDRRGRVLCKACNIDIPTSPWATVSRRAVRGCDAGTGGTCACEFSAFANPSRSPFTFRKSEFSTAAAAGLRHLVCLCSSHGRSCDARITALPPHPLAAATHSEPVHLLKSSSAVQHARCSAQRRHGALHSAPTFALLLVHFRSHLPMRNPCETTQHNPRNAKQRNAKQHEHDVLLSSTMIGA